jgi:hypothetical protein
MEVIQNRLPLLVVGKRTKMIFHKQKQNRDRRLSGSPNTPLPMQNKQTLLRVPKCLTLFVMFFFSHQTVLPIGSQKQPTRTYM